MRGCAKIKSLAEDCRHENEALKKHSAYPAPSKTISPKPMTRVPMEISVIEIITRVDGFL